MNQTETSEAGVSSTASSAVGPPPAAPPASDSLCWYDDGRPIVVYVDVAWTRIGYCAKHLGIVGDWLARCYLEQAA